MEYLFYPILIYLTISVVYYGIYSLASTYTKKDLIPFSAVTTNDIAVFIPAYKEDGIIFQTAKDALNQTYNRRNYDVYVIADSLKPETIAKLKTLPIYVIEVEFEKSTKAKAINKAYEAIDKKYQITVVLDSDNVMEPDFLYKINKEYNHGNSVIQGHRVAKNQENGMAVLDAISEEINNNIFRKGHQNLGLASALIGSGMAFDFELFKEKMAEIKAIGGFDKELELSFLKENINIKYAENAIVYDEKVSREEVFTNQRTRWIAAQIRFGIQSFGDACKHLITKGNVNYFDKSLQFLLPPRLILLGILVLLTAGSLFIQGAIFTWSILLLIGYTLTLLFATPKAFLNLQTLKACLLLPKTFFLMLVAFKGYKKAKTNFLHTPHQALQP